MHYFRGYFDNRSSAAFYDRIVAQCDVAQTVQDIDDLMLDLVVMRMRNAAGIKCPMGRFKVLQISFRSIGH